MDSFLAEAKAKKIRTLEEMNQFWHVWVDEYYHNKPHDGIRQYYVSQGWDYPEEGISPLCQWKNDSRRLRYLDTDAVAQAFLHGDAKRQLQREIEIIRGVHKKKVVCILDEAHLLEKETLEEFRFLLNYRFDSMSPMALILVGQTELWDEKLRLQRYAAIRQRIDMNCVLSHLDRSEVERYIQSHLQYAGGSTDIFTAKALDVVAKESSGIPRIINRICEKSLMYAFQQQHKLIDDYMVTFVVENEIAK